MGSDKVRVAVLGGGVGGMTAAYELTRPDPNRGTDYEVTVYQLGWRLGGKGASGRNAEHGDRIEEHGLHVWFSFYENAFAMMREVYGALGRDPDAPLGRIDTAFSPCPAVVLFDRIHGEWKSLTTRLPTLGDPPWCDAPQEPPTLFTMAKRAARMAHASLTRPGIEDAPPDALAALQDAERAADEAEHGEGLPETGLRIVLEHARRALNALEKHWGDSIHGHILRRQIFTAIDVFVATGQGVLDCEILDKGWSVIDDEDLVEWLRAHGAQATTLPADSEQWAPVVRSIYDVAFLFPKGRVRDASAAAGTGLSDLLKMMFGYRGDIAYKMNAGMGDAIFAPLYEVLRRRGVKFEFFKAVSELRVADGKVNEIDIIPQLELSGEYSPLRDVSGLPCWPSEPLWDKLPPEVSETGTRFETELDPLDRQAEHGYTLKLPDDFKHVVLAIPVGAHGLVCRPLIEASADFKAMVDGAATVPTQAFQIWTKSAGDSLGAPPSDSIATCFVEPLDTYCDMEHLLPRERWRPGEVAGLAYACGVLEDLGDSQDEANVRAEAAMRAYIRGPLSHVWKNRPDNLANEVVSMYWRANVAPWDLYVTTPAGSVKSRLQSDKSGFDNLTLAGDWTDNGINGGCVEAAVISGLRAARGLAGGGVESDQIIGEDTHWLTP